MTSPEYADPECPICNGRGWIYAKSMLVMPGDKGGHYCVCAMDYLRRANMERIWKSLSASETTPSLRETMPLKPFLKHNLWITGKENDFRAHLMAVAYSQSDMWDARVFSDKDLVKAWLGTAYAQGHKILDTEIDESMKTVQAMYIDELVEPPELLILVLGVKQAPNKETPNVLLEAIQSRLHIGKPMWIVDQPDARIDQPFHRAYSEHLEGILAHWTHVRLTSSRVLRAGHDQERVEATTRRPAEVERKAAEPDRIDEALADLEDESEEDESVPVTRNLLDQELAREDAADSRGRKKAVKARGKKPSRPKARKDS